MEITVDAGPLTRYLNDFEERQAPFALANALNDTAKLFQYRERQHIQGAFIVRRRDWVDRSVKITQFATKRNLVASVAIQAPGNAARSDILGKFETATQKTPHAGGRSIAVPFDARRNKAGVIAFGARPKAFNFRRVGGAKALSHNVTKRIQGGIGRGAIEVYEGDKNTVMIRNAQGTGVILQRVGRGKNRGAMRVLFFLRPKVKLTPNLKFLPNAREAMTHFAAFFRARFVEAMSTAR